MVTDKAKKTKEVKRLEHVYHRLILSNVGASLDTKQEPVNKKLYTFSHPKTPWSVMVQFVELAGRHRGILSKKIIPPETNKPSGGGLARELRNIRKGAMISSRLCPQATPTLWP